MTAAIIFAPYLKRIKKTSTMKKVFAILAVAGVMAACNSGENKDAAAAAADSARIADSIKAAAAAAAPVDTTHADTTKAAADTTKK
ncbi:hypothetical protein [Sediminibacterium ginsengisoli]|uniref:Entericidin EcnA/B family protein n=1 Tax=Sediminibacterium ginsengisoli TaxID=413434 RepID=A0A1T4QR29_9BACT|nr:hypothetical protein [Sediminibacterium ginsengisoli]SKA06155.1 hypothetical protein SAMN04488132_10944 [Sediminibacterium ginsengisoli]